MHYQPRVKASHHAGDELPMGYKSGEKEGGENYKIRTASLGIKAKLPRIQSETMCYHMHVLRGWSLDHFRVCTTTILDLDILYGLSIFAYDLSLYFYNKFSL